MTRAVGSPGRVLPGTVRCAARGSLFGAPACEDGGNVIPLRRSEERSRSLNDYRAVASS